MKFISISKTLSIGVVFMIFFCGCSQATPDQKSIETAIAQTQSAQSFEAEEIKVTNTPSKTAQPTLTSKPTNTAIPSITPTPTKTPLPTNTPLPSNTPTPETPDSPKEDGFYTVGSEIVPGKWESTGSGNNCYWERLDENQEIIRNHFGAAGGTITITELDYEVQLKNCGIWVYVEDLDRDLQSNASDPKKDGFYTVGVEISPGKWESSGSGDSCYWERLDENQEILRNHFGYAGGTATIKVTDYEVHFKECGDWIYVEGIERILQSDASEPKEDGFYTVGVEISPGKWESTGSSDSCYWERLDDTQEIIRNHYGLAGGTVTILATDYEIHFKNCGSWNYLGP